MEALLTREVLRPGPGRGRCVTERHCPGVGWGDRNGKGRVSIAVRPQNGGKTVMLDES